MKFEHRPYKQGDVIAMGKLKSTASDNDSVERGVIRRIETGSKSTSILLDNRVVAVVSLTESNRNIHFNVVISHGITKCAISFHKLILENLKTLAESYKRLSMDVNCNYRDGLKWAHALGFKPEGLMKNFGVDGSDHILLARTK